jgi:hypothetical protein
MPRSMLFFGTHLADAGAKAKNGRRNWHLVGHALLYRHLTEV